MVLRERIRDISLALGKLNLASTQSLAPILAEIRELSELESICLYSLSNRNGRWEVSRFETAGCPEAEPLLRRVYQRDDDFPLYFAPQSPPREQRNKVLDAIDWIDRHRPGSWERNPMCHAVLRPLGMHHHRQPRALLYEGTTQLAWFGGLHPKKVTSRQFRILSALVEPMRRRLATERRIFGKPYLVGALAATLERLGAPAFVLHARGTIFEANAAGDRLLTIRGNSLLQLLRCALHGEPSSEIELVPVSHEGEAPYFLAIVHETSSQARVAACIDHCQTRWRLTERQREVLTHVVAGLSNAAIAAVLDCVERTIELHVSALLDRAAVDNRAALVSKVLTALP